ncbi:type IV pilus modification PilV family protein [Metaplanococcus flavidus]|uniref:Prepilin-type N-terminal cleavage/methylation domain-containing protein n=1 Tax=Metaplanococcus flavidus TaxID=569883 RepID=A0ABW3L803_9BACL
MKRSWDSNEKGLTLVEVLAALVILGILFVGIMTIFPQMTLFNEKTGTKLDTMNLARQEMVEITTQDKWHKVILSDPEIPETNVPEYLKEEKLKYEMAELGYSESTSPGPADTVRFHRTGDYLYEVDVYMKCEEFLNDALIGSEPPTAGNCEAAERDKLYKVHLKLYKESPAANGSFQMSSETFSYITYSAINEPLPVSGGG